MDLRAPARPRFGYQNRAWHVAGLGGGDEEEEGTPPKEEVGARTHHTAERPGPSGTFRGACRGPQRRDRYFGLSAGGAGEHGPGGRRALQGGAPGARGATVPPLPPRPPAPRNRAGQEGASPPNTEADEPRAEAAGPLRRGREGGEGRRVGGPATAGVRGGGGPARRGSGFCPQRLPGGRRWRRGRACSGARRAYRGREVPGPPGRW